MSSYNVGDQVLMSGDREGTVRYVGSLDGKNGIFYGIELSTGNGKHNGTFQGKKYFTCPPGKGLFLNKSQIICRADDPDKDLKIQDDDKKSKSKSKDEDDSNNANKMQPKDDRQRSKSNWRPPQWAKEFTAHEEEDNIFAERYSSMYGKKYELKGLYGSRGHPGFKKFSKKHWSKWTADDWKAWQDYLDEENNMIEKKRTRSYR